MDGRTEDGRGTGERAASGLEVKFQTPGNSGEAGFTVRDGRMIEGYASLFGRKDQGGDIVLAGAYAESLKRMAAAGRKVKMLWQHDPAQPIGIWDEVKEDGRGLWVKGRLLAEVEKGREAAALLEAGAIDGLSIGYRTLRAERDGKNQRLLQELDLWEVSLVTFPMLPEARVAAQKADMIETGPDGVIKDIAALFRDAAKELARR